MKRLRLIMGLAALGVVAAAGVLLYMALTGETTAIAEPQAALSPLEAPLPLRLMAARAPSDLEGQARYRIIRAAGATAAAEDPDVFVLLGTLEEDEPELLREDLQYSDLEHELLLAQSGEAPAVLMRSRFPILGHDVSAVSADGTETPARVVWLDLPGLVLAAAAMQGGCDDAALLYMPGTQPTAFPLDSGACEEALLVRACAPGAIEAEGFPGVDAGPDCPELQLQETAPPEDRRVGQTSIARSEYFTLVDFVLTPPENNEDDS